MELIIAIAVLAIIAWVGYTYVLDKEKSDGSHPLDSVKGNSEFPPMPVLTKTGDVVDIQPAADSPKVEAIPESVNTQITDAVTQTPSKEKKMATKKPAPAKEPKKPAPAKKPKK